MRLLTTTIFAFFLAIVSISSSAQSNKDAHCRTIRLLYKNLQKRHFNPIELTDVTGKRVLETVIYELDPDHIYFSKAEIKALQSKQNLIDDQIKEGKCNMLSEITQSYSLALERAIEKINLLADSTLIFTQEESIFLARKEFQESLFPTESQINSRLKKYLKWDILDKLSTDSDMGKVVELEEKYRKQTCERWVKQLQEQIDELQKESNLVSSSYFNAIAKQYDPHTAYYSVNEMKMFETMLSDSEYTFGFGFAETKRGGLKIVELLPGGSAWKSNELNEGDLLKTLKTASGTTHNLHFMTASELGSLLDSFRHRDKITLTVQKKTGAVKSVQLQKEKTENEDNVINSFLLDGKQKTGYISLPSFYTDMEGETNLGCANDIAKQLINLKKDNIEGLIIDLRNNGGGSMQEAIDMIGMFIDVGPVAIKRNADEKLIVLKDFNRGKIYDGPIVVLTNRFSASASEFFAAALQDYNRAVIVGGTTFGKSTGQNIVPLAEDVESEILESWANNSDIGFMKVTTFKFYRITGKSHQKMGVVPDISLPQLLDALPIGEDSYPTALVADSVVKKTYARLLPALPIQTLWNKSNDRVKANSVFQSIPERLSEWYAKLLNPISEIPLQKEAYEKYMAEKKALIALLDLETAKPVSAFNVELSLLDREILMAIPDSKAVYDIRKARLEKDIYLEEAYQILSDWIGLK
ncbi:MAG: carboxyl-terminal processing protease [Bacteroidia bacterium]|jgi:carboxyl-terminal processing protease